MNALSLRHFIDNIPRTATSYVWFPSTPRHLKGVDLAKVVRPFQEYARDGGRWFCVKESKPSRDWDCPTGCPANAMIGTIRNHELSIVKAGCILCDSLLIFTPTSIIGDRGHVIIWIDSRHTVCLCAFPWATAVRSITQLITYGGLFRKWRIFTVIWIPHRLLDGHRC